MPEKFLTLLNTFVRRKEVLEMCSEMHTNPKEDLIMYKFVSSRDSSLSAQIDKPSEPIIYHKH